MGIGIETGGEALVSKGRIITALLLLGAAVLGWIAPPEMKEPLLAWAHQPFFQLPTWQVIGILFLVGVMVRGLD